jgi:hypothetical protein
MVAPMCEFRKIWIVTGVRWAFGALEKGPPCPLTSTTSWTTSDPRWERDVDRRPGEERS